MEPLSNFLPDAHRNGMRSSGRRGISWMNYAGAGALVAVGYMDPGNWATALAGGARYGYRLLSVVALASLMAMLLQWIAARVGVVTGRDLAQLCRERFSRRTTLALWIASEVAIVACDVAEVVGSAVALQLLLHVPLWVGVLLSALGTLGMLVLHGRSRSLEATITLLLLFIAICFVAQLALAGPDWSEAAHGLVPSSGLVRDAGIVWLAVGIVGATVMPHNLYLHSALVKNHGLEDAKSTFAIARGKTTALLTPLQTAETRRKLTATLRAVSIDTLGSLSFAFAINASLLIVAAAVFHASGHTDVSDLSEAHRLLAPLVGSHWASLLFASALLACGLNSTVTGTLAGQAIMEGFLQLRLAAPQRALVTRALAIGPALAAVLIWGEHGSANLLIASQVVLSLTLPLAVVPLIRFAADRTLLADWRLRGITLWLAWMAAGIIVLLNIVLLWQSVTG
ncbi:manganese transport protein [Paraburkholderia sp. CI2]|nr:manganese transport protein [Paraburkholderia sp. CI2]